MNINIARLQIEEAFKNAETISDFKMKVHNIIGDIYYYNDIASYTPDEAKIGYEITQSGELINQ